MRVGVAVALVLAACTTHGPTASEPTTSSIRHDRTCAGTDPDPLPALPAVTPRWQAGTVGARGGFAMGSGIFFNPQADVDRQLDLAAASGARWLRLDVDWSYAEPDPGRYDWCRADRVIVGARQRGMDVVGLLAYAPEWANGSAENTHVAPKSAAAFATFAAAAVARYAPIGVHTWEVWNEPNMVDFWAPKPDPAAYGALLAATGREIHALDPEAFVVSAGLAPAPDTADGRYLAPLTFLTAFYDAADRASFDAVGIHPYSYPAPPTGNQSWNEFGHLDDLHALMDAHGDGAKPLWLTEYGAPTGYAKNALTESVQADFVADVYDAADALGYAGPVFWYSLRDEGDDQFDLFENFGLVRHNFTAKQSLAAFDTEMAKPD